MSLLPLSSPSMPHLSDIAEDSLDTSLSSLLRRFRDGMTSKELSESLDTTIEQIAPHDPLGIERSLHDCLVGDLRHERFLTRPLKAIEIHFLLKVVNFVRPEERGAAWTEIARTLTDEGRSEMARSLLKKVSDVERSQTLVA